MSRLLLIVIAALLGAPLTLATAQEASPVPPVTREPLLSVVLPAESLPTGETLIFYDRVRVGPGGSYTEEGLADGVLLSYHVSGESAVRSGGPLQVVGGTAAPGITDVAPGEEVTVGPGEAVVWLENELLQEVRFLGDEPTTLVEIGVFSTAFFETPPSEPTNTDLFEVSGNIVPPSSVAASGILGGDIEVRLERVVLDPGQTTPPVASPALQMVFPLDGGAVSHGEMRNTGQAPVEVIVATLTPLEATGATPAAATPTAGQFTASVSGSITWARVSAKSCPPSEQLWGELMSEASATGTASGLGEVTMESRHCTPVGDEITDGALTLVTADGDEIWMDYTGTAPFPSDTDIGDVLPFDGDFTVVGGTGPFEHATGTGSFDAEIIFEGLPDPEWPATWTFEGTIDY